MFCDPYSTIYENLNDVLQSYGFANSEDHICKESFNNII